MSRIARAALACLFVVGSPVLAERADLDLGRSLYERHCVYCHGASGDARTIASGFLDPKPRDFTSPAGAALTREQIGSAVRDGRTGTAMQSFSRVLGPAEIAAVREFVFDRFVVRKARGAGYHTAANGWPDHERYRAAFPFASGELSVHAADLTPEQAAGRSLFGSACRTCHENGGAPRLAWDLRAVPFPQNADACGACHASRGTGPHRQPGFRPPSGDFSAEERRGEDLFRANCAFCHAADGSGRNWIGAFLEPHPRNLAEPAFRARISPGRLAETIRTGTPGTSMPAWGSVLDKAEIGALVAYLSRAFGPLSGGRGDPD